MPVRNAPFLKVFCVASISLLIFPTNTCLNWRWSGHQLRGDRVEKKRGTEAKKGKKGIAFGYAPPLLQKQRIGLLRELSSQQSCADAIVAAGVDCTVRQNRIRTEHTAANVFLFTHHH
jgi:hypothetical protein